MSAAEGQAALPAHGNQKVAGEKFRKNGCEDVGAINSKTGLREKKAGAPHLAFSVITFHLGPISFLVTLTLWLIGRVVNLSLSQCGSDRLAPNLLHHFSQ